MLAFMTNAQNDYITRQMHETDSLRVCMDSMHGIGGYGFELTTIMTVSGNS